MYVCIYIYCVYSNENTIADLFAQLLNHGCENAACQISVQSILILLVFGFCLAWLLFPILASWLLALYVCSGT